MTEHYLQTAPVVAFDLFGVLLPRRRGVVRHLASVTGSTEGAVERAVFGSEIYPGLRVGEGTVDMLAREFNRAFECSMTTAEFADCWRHEVPTLSADVLELLKWCRGWCGRLVLVSEMHEMHWRRLKLDPAIGLFDQVVASCEYGALKASGDLYRVAFAGMGPGAARVIVVDDKLDNVRAARGLGYQAIQFDLEADSIEDLRRDLRRVAEGQ